MGDVGRDDVVGRCSDKITIYYVLVYPISSLELVSFRLEHGWIKSSEWC